MWIRGSLESSSGRPGTQENGWRWGPTARCCEKSDGRAATNPYFHPHDTLTRWFLASGNLSGQPAAPILLTNGVGDALSQLDRGVAILGADFGYGP